MNTFSDFGLLESLAKTLKSQKISKPTEIQRNTIPLMMSGQSVVGVSETGSGKTLSYALPLLHMLKALENEGQGVTEEATPRAIVMVPTRELGEQVSKVFKTLTHDTRLRVRPALGGMAMEQARRNTSGAFEILLATPGRLVQLMDRNLIKLTDVRLLVFDEADQMMDQGFLPDSNKIYYECPKDVQLALFSATVSTAVQELLNNLFANAEIFRSTGSGKTVETLKTSNRIVKDGKRWPLLEKILAEPTTGGTILFTNTREQCDNLAKELADNGYEAVIYRGEMEKSDRRQNLRKFSTGKVKLLVATDLAGRGLDLPDVDRVINYHLPKQKDNYLHRAGRTARAGRKGTVINLVTERDEPLLAQIEGRKLPTVRDPSKYRGTMTTAKTQDTRPAAKPAAKKSFAAKPDLKKDGAKPKFKDSAAKAKFKEEPKSKFKSSAKKSDRYDDEESPKPFRDNSRSIYKNGPKSSKRSSPR